MDAETVALLVVCALGAVAILIAILEARSRYHQLKTQLRRMARNRDFWKRAYGDEHEFTFRWPER